LSHLYAYELGLLLLCVDGDQRPKVPQQLINLQAGNQNMMRDDSPPCSAAAAAAAAAAVAADAAAKSCEVTMP
jgi:hypothetical protein